MAFDATKITVPDLEYAGDYYPQIVSRMRRLNRVRAPEITNEDERELFILLEKAFGLGQHYNNVLLDMVANSMFLDTSRIPESTQSLLELMGTSLFPANPAQVDVLAKLHSRYAVPVRLLTAFKKFATRKSNNLPEIIFENIYPFDLSFRNDSQGLEFGFGMTPDVIQTGASVSSVDPDILTDPTGPFSSSMVGQYIRVYNSSIGNDIEPRRVLEIIDSNNVRLDNVSFTTEDGLSWQSFSVSENCASEWNTGVAKNPFGVNMDPRSMIFIGHSNVMWDRIDAAFAHAATVGYKTVWEFYDPLENSTSPDNVYIDVPGASQMTFDLTSLLGVDDVSGALVEIQYIPTGALYRKFSELSGGVNVVVIDNYMGQTEVSDSITDYIVKCDWRPIEIDNDETILANSSWLNDGKIEFALPMTQHDSWYKYRLYDSDAGELNLAYFLRLRIIENPGPPGSAPIIPNRVRIDRGSQHIVFRTVQGRTIEERNLSSNGQPNQQIVLKNKPFVYQSGRVFVTEGATEYEWLSGSSFLRSRSTSRHCAISPQPDGSAILKFGDGLSGRIPPIGTNNIRVVYRVDADTPGNIGAGVLNVNRDGVGTFSEITNPKKGMFWIEADWSSQKALENAKQRAPAVFQTMKRSVNAADAAVLAKYFRNSAGTRVVRRAKAYEESFGPKTLELVVVGGGGAALTAANKEELEEYFNGGETYGFDGINLHNSRIVVTNYIPRKIALNIRIEAYPTITEKYIKSVLARRLSPTAIELNGRGYMWRFGQSVPLSKITSIIFHADRANIFDVDITSPTEDFALVSRELPMFDPTLSNITIIPPRFEE